ncbi:hypothetical protein T492DRAFT_196286 [Pavlovales sp. CCMP2436]|nr:hypothetical protein T492DRAFT_196286 [Pavlovales sp. CCMP2436]
MTPGTFASMEELTKKREPRWCAPLSRTRGCVWLFSQSRLRAWVSNLPPPGWWCLLSSRGTRPTCSRRRTGHTASGRRVHLGRAHRIGQTRPVDVAYLLLSGSVDDFIWPCVNKKLDTVSRALDGCGSSLKADGVGGPKAGGKRSATLAFEPVGAATGAQGGGSKRIESFFTAPVPGAAGGGGSAQSGPQQCSAPSGGRAAQQQPPASAHWPLRPLNQGQGQAWQVSPHHGGDTALPAAGGGRRQSGPHASLSGAGFVQGVDCAGGGGGGGSY